MIVGIHQPQYLPWLPYLLKIDESELFVFLDSVDFQKNGIQNRNQIKTAQGKQWLTVPVQHRLGQSIREVKIAEGVDWAKKHWVAIAQNYGKSACFRQYSEELEAVYLERWTSLSDLNFKLLALLMKWMNIGTRTIRSSELETAGKASELVLGICKAVGAKIYLSGVGASDYLDVDSFRDASIEVVYRKPRLPSEYRQLHPKVGFLPDLSALDLVLNCGADWRRYVPAI